MTAQSYFKVFFEPTGFWDSYKMEQARKTHILTWMLWKWSDPNPDGHINSQLTQDWS